MNCCVPGDRAAEIGRSVMVVSSAAMFICRVMCGNKQNQGKYNEQQKVEYFYISFST